MGVSYLAIYGKGLSGEGRCPGANVLPWSLPCIVLADINVDCTVTILLSKSDCGIHLDALESDSVASSTV